jgi:hypothetical protein
MRRGLFIVGIVLLVVGAILFGWAFFTFASDSSQTVPNIQSQSIETLTPPPGFGTYTFSASWSGAPASTSVYVVPCSTSDCSTVAIGGAIASGSGSSGSLSATMSPGTTYAIFAAQSSGPATPVTVTYHFSGFTDLMLIGVIVLVLGVVIAVIGARLSPRVVPVPVATTTEEETTSAPAAPYAIPAKITPSSATNSAPSTPAARPATPPARAPTPPVPAPASLADEEPEVGTTPRFMPASSASDGTASPTSRTGSRPDRTCTFCGTVNEPWITNCRKCKRPLASTGTS